MGFFLNKDTDILLSDEYTQRQFFKDSIFNSVILFRNILSDYFNYFLFKLSPLSRYEFWCFSLFSFVSTILLLSIVSIISYTIAPVGKYAYGLFYIYVFLLANLAIRVFASRLLSVQNFVKEMSGDSHKGSKINITIINKIESIIKKIFLSIKLYITIAYIKMFLIIIYIINKWLLHSDTLYFYFKQLQDNPVLHLFIFILKVVTIIYIIFMVSPSLNRLEYLENKQIKYYKVSFYQTWYSKEYIVDYLTLAASIFSVISVGHLLIIGYSFSCHIIVSLSLLCQGAALLLSGRFFCVMAGLVSIVFYMVSSISVIIGGIEIFHYPDIVIEFVKYYQITIAFLFFGIFYYSSYDRDVVKMAAVLGCYLSALFLWEDENAVRGIMVYDNHTIPVLIYGLVSLFTFFIYLMRVANSKGLYRMEWQYLSVTSDFKTSASLIKTKYIYMILLISSIIMILFALIFLLDPIFTNGSLNGGLDNYILKFLINIRRLVAFYMLLGLYLLFKNNNDAFPMLVIAFVVCLEMYIILYPSLKSLLSMDTLYSLKYVYMYIYGLMFILSISLSKYSLLLSTGFSLSLISFITGIISILFNYTYANNVYLYNIIFISLLIANILVFAGSYRKIKIENNGEK